MIRRCFNAWSPRSAEEIKSRRSDLRSSGKIVEMALETGVEFLDPANANSTSSRASKPIGTVKLQIKTIFKALPFFEREQVAPRRVAECKSFIWTRGLSVVDICRAGKSGSQ